MLGRALLLQIYQTCVGVWLRDIFSIYLTISTQRYEVNPCADMLLISLPCDLLSNKIFVELYKIFPSFSTPICFVIMF